MKPRNIRDHIKTGISECWWLLHGQPQPTTVQVTQYFQSFITSC